MGKKRGVVLSKKGANISLFIIVGIMMLVVIIIFFALIGKVVFRGNSQFKEVENYVDTCFEQVSNNALVYVSKQGGIYVITQMDKDDLLLYDEEMLKEFSPPHINDIKGMNLEKEPIFLDAIDKDLYEYEVSRATGFLLKQCLNNFSDFQQFNTDHDKVDMNISTDIQKNGVTIFMDYPVTFTLGGNSRSQMTLSEKSTYFPVHLYDMIRLGNKIIKGGNYMIDFEKFGEEYQNLQLEVLPFEDYHLLFIKDSSKIRGKQFKLVFVVENKEI